MDTQWEIPKYDLDRLKAQARALLLEAGEDPRDSLKVYWLVTQLRGEELRRRIPILNGHVLIPAERRLLAVPEAKSARLADGLASESDDS